MPAWWTDKDLKRKQNSRSAKMERRVAKEVGGRTQVGSGSSWRAPGDIKSDTHLIEHKYTDKLSFVLKLADWEQARSDALQSGKDAAMIVEFASTGKRLLVTEVEVEP